MKRFAMNPEQLSIAGKGFLGLLATITAQAISFQQQQIEWWFRVTSLALGCVVAILTIISIIRKNRQ